MHSAHDVHLAMLKRVLRYVKGKPTIGIQLRLMTTPMLTGYTNVD
jgi:hypothetical protein